MLFVRKSRQIDVLARCAAAALTCVASAGVLACSSSDAGSPGSGAVTAAGAPGSAGSGSPGNTAGHTSTTAGTGNANGGASSVGASGSAGAPAVSGGGAPSAQAGGSAVAGSAGAAHTTDHCVDGYDPDPSDATMVDGPVEFTKSNQIDLTVQPGVLSWFSAHVWEQAHFQWHNIRRCKGGLMAATDDPQGGGINPCTTHPELVPANQEGHGAGDGLEFLAMHRHMIQSLKQLWPKHTEQFEGWDHFPTQASDVPKQWQADWTAWMSSIATAGAAADDPSKHMSDKGFETEGDFGQWIQTTSGLHGALHFKWVRPSNSEHGLGNQFTNIDNYMFWKMHGWIDKVWDKYRAAKGKGPNDQDIKDAVLQQCRGMDQLALIVKPSLGTGTTCTPAPVQTGVFVDTIRPIFESATNKCTGCHGPSGPNANLTLGGSDCVKSSDIVSHLVNVPSTSGGQFKLIAPGDPDHSWLYLLVTGKAATAGCTAMGSANCLTDSMPYGGGITVTTAQADAIKSWIMSGATAPQ